MSWADRTRWDARHTLRESEPPGPPRPFAEFVDHFPTSGRALELACGGGSVAVWLAQRGLDVLAVDVSPVAVADAARLAESAGVTDRCRFAVADLDDGLPAGPPVDVLLCQRFRDPRLDAAIRARVVPGGLLAVTALSEVGAAPGRFRAAAGELTGAYRGFDVITDGERDGLAWLLARR